MSKVVKIQRKKRGISEQEFENIEVSFIRQIQSDLNEGDHTAISEMLRQLLSDETSSKVVLAYLPE